MHAPLASTHPKGVKMEEEEREKKKRRRRRLFLPFPRLPPPFFWRTPPLSRSQFRKELAAPAAKSKKKIFAKLRDDL